MRIIAEGSGFLGHIVNREGVTPNPAKLEEVSNWEAPGSKKDLESFLGLAGYYRDFGSM